MGALHAGHISLIRACREKCGFTVVSIFVNPSQFGPGEDLESYPRDFEKDSKICEDEGVDLIFAPPTGVMYPNEQLGWVTVEKLTENLCGRFRPVHFKGVTTVCAKLFNIVGPDFAFFGQKDAQQAIVIKRMVEDLNMPLEIVVCPIVREPDGLAMSSRNKYLSGEQRKDAVLLYKSLLEAQRTVEKGVRQADKVLETVKGVLGESALLKPQYVQAVDPKTLEDVETIEQGTLIAIAVYAGETRLIDNIILDLNNQGRQVYNRP